MIWHNKDIQVDQLFPVGQHTLGEHLGMQFVELGDNYIKASMPVDHRTKQPYGLLHGGASVALAETLGSVGAALVVDSSLYYCVGMEINANHVRSVKDGIVIGTATPIHLGANTHVWEIKIHTPTHKLVCISRLTVAIIKIKS